MRHTATTWLAWSLAGLSFVLAAATVALYILSRSSQPPSTWGTSGDSAVLIFVLPFLAFPIVGALIASKRPENPIGWICLAAGIFWMLTIVTSGYGVYGLVTEPDSVPFPAAIGSLTEWIWAPSLGLLGTFMILLFPNGKLPSRRWLPFAWLSGAAIVLASAGVALSPGRLTDLDGIQNPSGLKGYPWIESASGVMLVLLLLCILVSAFSLILRYRRVRSEERQQIKWIAVAASFVGLIFLSYFISSLLFVPEGFENGGKAPLWFKLIQDAATLSYVGVPTAIGFAVLKYRLYDIDILINRALVYGTLTTLLVLCYFGGVVLLQTTFRTLTGQESQLAVVASTLTIAALFGPLRRRIQDVIDRRFYRRKYDAARTLETFGVKLRNETDLKELSDDLMAVVNETMQPEHISLWLQTTGRHSADKRGVRE